MGKLILVVSSDAGSDCLESSLLVNCLAAFFCAGALQLRANTQDTPLPERDYDFVLIDEEQSFADLVGRIARVNRHKQIAVLAHISGGSLEIVRHVLRTSQIQPFCEKEFHHGDPFWNSFLKPTLTCLKNAETDQYEELFKELWSEIAPKPFEVAHSLRCSVLTPLVALDLLLQVGNNIDSSKKLEFTSQIKQTVQSREFTEKYKQLCQRLFHVDDWDGFSEHVRTVAQNGVINQSALEKFARELESRISQL
jgi:hypothetical protein